MATQLKGLQTYDKEQLDVTSLGQIKTEDKGVIRAEFYNGKPLLISHESAEELVRIDANNVSTYADSYRFKSDAPVYGVTRDNLIIDESGRVDYPEQVDGTKDLVLGVQKDAPMTWGKLYNMYRKLSAPVPVTEDVIEEETGTVIEDGKFITVKKYGDWYIHLSFFPDKLKPMDLNSTITFWAEFRRIMTVYDAEGNNYGDTEQLGQRDLVSYELLGDSANYIEIIEVDNKSKNSKAFRLTSTKLWNNIDVFKKCPIRFWYDKGGANPTYYDTEIVVSQLKDITLSGETVTLKHTFYFDDGENGIHKCLRPYDMEDGSYKLGAVVMSLYRNKDYNVIGQDSSKYYKMYWEGQTMIGFYSPFNIKSVKFNGGEDVALYERNYTELNSKLQNIYTGSKDYGFQYRNTDKLFYNYTSQDIQSVYFQGKDLINSIDVEYEIPIELQDFYDVSSVNDELQGVGEDIEVCHETCFDFSNISTLSIVDASGNFVSNVNLNESLVNKWIKVDDCIIGFRRLSKCTDSDALRADAVIEMNTVTQKPCLRLGYLLQVTIKAPKIRELCFDKNCNLTMMPSTENAQSIIYRDYDSAKYYTIKADDSREYFCDNNKNPFWYFWDKSNNDQDPLFTGESKYHQLIGSLSNSEPYSSNNTQFTYDVWCGTIRGGYDDDLNYKPDTINQLYVRYYVTKKLAENVDMYFYWQMTKMPLPILNPPAYSTEIERYLPSIRMTKAMSPKKTHISYQVSFNADVRGNTGVWITDVMQQHWDDYLHKMGDAGAAGKIKIKRSEYYPDGDYIVTDTNGSVVRYRLHALAYGEHIPNNARYWGEINRVDWVCTLDSTNANNYYSYYLQFQHPVQSFKYIGAIKSGYNTSFWVMPEMELVKFAKDVGKNDITTTRYDDCMSWADGKYTYRIYRNGIKNPNGAAPMSSDYNLPYGDTMWYSNYKIIETDADGVELEDDVQVPIYDLHLSLVLPNIGETYCVDQNVPLSLFFGSGKEALFVCHAHIGTLVEVGDNYIAPIVLDIPAEDINSVMEGRWLYSIDEYDISLQIPPAAFYNQTYKDKLGGFGASGSPDANCEIMFYSQRKYLIDDKPIEE